MASGSEGQTAPADQEETKGQEEAGNEQDRAGSAEESPDSGNQEQGGGGEEGQGGEEEEGRDSHGSSTAIIDDVSSLPGETVNDQDGRKVGEVKEIYGVGDDETPMWVTIESATGLGRSRDVFVPLARIKRQKDEIRVPYSYAHLHESPEVEAEDELSEEDDRALRVYYAIGLADQEMVEDAQSYASQVPDEDEPARKIDASAAEGPVREIDDRPPAERAAEAYEKQKEEEGEEHRKSSGATADDIFEEDGAGGDKSEDDNSDDESKAEKESNSKEEPKAEQKSASESESKSEGESKSEDESDED